MRIAFYSDSYTPYVSGVVRSIQRFTKGLVKQGHEVYIFAPFYYGKELDTEMAQHSDPYASRVFRFYSIPAPTHPSYFLPLPFTFQSEKLLRNLEIDIIHTHSPFLTGQLGAILARRLQVPLFFTHHTMYHEYLHYIPAPHKVTKQVVLNVVKRYCSHCTHIIAPTDVTRQTIQDLYQLKTPITALPTGIDLEPYRNVDKEWLRTKLQIPKDHSIILSLGRLSKEKNSHLLLEAFQIIQKSLPTSHFVFVGAGAEREHLQTGSVQLGLETKVHFTGNLNEQDVVRAYAGSDLFMFASQTETQGLVTLEAMAASLPVVAVDGTGTNAVVIHGKNGYLTAPDPKELAKYACEILTRPSLRDALKKMAHEQAQNYSVEITAAQLAHLYEEELRNHSPSRS